MNALLTWALGLLASTIARHLAETFAGACPFDPGAWVCVHWADIAQIGGAILGALGYGPGKKAATAFASRVLGRAPLKADAPPPLPAPTPEQIQTDGDAQIAAASHQGP